VTISRRTSLLAAAAVLLPARAWAQADLPSLIAGSRSAVVPVGTFNPTDNPRFGFRGSGFVVGDGRTVITNFHVLASGADTPNGPRMAVSAARSGELLQLRMAKVVATDRVRDLAVLQIEGAALPALALAEPGGTQEGQSIALMGFPIGGVLGFAPVTHRGIVSSLTTVALPAPTSAQLDPRTVARLRDGSNFEVLQLDAVAYPGNSGGPVIDASGGPGHGRVIGVVTSVLVKGSRESAISTPTGITYAVPVLHVQRLLEEWRGGRGTLEPAGPSSPTIAPR
jgi:serine protease Do